MVSFKLREITKAINFLGEGRSTLTIDQVQKKWPDVNLMYKLRL